MCQSARLGQGLDSKAHKKRYATPDPRAVDETVAWPHDAGVTGPRCGSRSSASSPDAPEDPTRTTNPLRPPPRAVQSATSIVAADGWIAVRRAEGYRTHHDEPLHDRVRRRTLTFHAPDASANPGRECERPVLPHQRLRQLPGAGPSHRERDLSHLRPRPPGALTLGHDAPCRTARGFGHSLTRLH